MRRVEPARRAEVDPQPQVGLVGPLAQIDAGLPPCAVTVQLLNVLVREPGGVGRNRERGRKLAVSRVSGRLHRVIRREQLPRRAVILRDKHTGAVLHRGFITRGRCSRVGLQEVVKIESRLVGGGASDEAEGVRGETAIGAPRQVVGVGNRGVRGESRRPVGADHPVLAAFEAEIHALTTGGFRDAVPFRSSIAGVVPHVKRRVHAVTGIRAPPPSVVPEVDVERREGEACRPSSSGLDADRIGNAVAICVENWLKSTVGIEAIEIAGAVDPEQFVAKETTLQVLRPDGQAFKRDWGTANRDVTNECGRDREVVGFKTAHGEEIAGQIHAVQRVAQPRHARRPHSARREFALDSPVLTGDDGGRTRQRISAVQE